ncbi:MAG: hypothetical protein EBS25_02850 [Actinobacteria bacterium]|nr:hypothetical protein [Actinomycetota bacterium]
MQYIQYLKPEPDQHYWYVEADHVKKQIFQACICGWKTRVRDFYGSWCTYDVAYFWVNHFEDKRVD